MVGQTIHLSEMDKWRDDDDKDPNTSQDFTRTHKKFYFSFIKL